MELDLTAAALKDLQSIRTYTLEEWGEEQEDLYLDRMWNRFDEILPDPGRWRRREDLFKDCQLATQGKHVILFRVQGEVLQIVRVLHSMMDFKSHLPQGL